MRLLTALQSNALAGLCRLTALLAGSLALAACGAGHDADCLKSNGTVTTQRRAVDRRLRFVVVYNNVDLTIVPDTATFAEVRAGENVIDDIKFSNPGGPQKLVIENTSRCNWVRSYDTPREVRLHLKVDPSCVTAILLTQRALRKAREKWLSVLPILIVQPLRGLSTSYFTANLLISNVLGSTDIG